LSSFATGVGHPANIATSFSGRAFLSCWLLRPSRQSRAAAVGHPASKCVTFSCIETCRPSEIRFSMRLGLDPRPPWCASSASGVGHPVQSLSDVRGATARSAQICRPNGVTRVFQVSRYKVKPLKGSRARNLFTK
jgi:hypothetical protein